jgi:starch synthase
VKTVISTAGRFHLFALARELEKRGHLERIYSGFIWSALAREAVPRDKVTTFPWFRTPYMALGRLPVAPPRGVARWLETMSCVAQDAYVATRLPSCDVFIGHDGAGLRAGREAQRRGGVYVADTGVTHVKFRRELMQEESKSYGVPVFVENDKVNERIIEEYETADTITVPSTFVKNSFVDQGVPVSKVHVIPYGVRTAHFRPVSAPPAGEFRVLFVGALSVRKGARYLFEAFRDFPHPRKELTIVGTVAEEVRPLIASAGGLNIKRLGPIPHMELNRIYSSSHVFVLPSVEEGLAMVMAEALACGCPVIASTNTGAGDLFTHGREGLIVPVRDSSAIRDCLIRLADEPELRERMAAAAIARVNALDGWSAYGEKFFNLLGQMLGSRTDAREPPRALRTVRI